MKRPPPPNRRAIALIMVLGTLALMMVLVTALFTASTNERSGAMSARNTDRAQALHDTAVNLVLGQVRAATASRDAGGQPVNWASQPGAIRSWDATGAFKTGYRLYSSPSMVQEGGTELAFATDAPPADWNSAGNIARLVDMNAPVRRTVSGQAKAYFPIFDPRLAETPTLINGMEGFSYDPINGSKAASTLTDLEARLPMPVTWLYQLRDGTLGTLNASGKFQGQTAPSEVNPIVGRVAFWTDDESSKLNLNAIGEPTAWDTPRCLNKIDVGFGQSQPVLNEFQRYPGHPYGNALSTFLYPNRATPVSNAEKEALYAVLPRIREGGSKQGTINTASINTSNGFITTDAERLYANADEFVFKPDHMTLNPLVNASEAALATGALTPEKLGMAQGFLTTASRAPELNMLGLPRVSMWPVDDPSRGATYHRSAFDQLAAFCTTLPGGLYSFQRARNNSSTYDWDNIRRNRELFYYLRSLLEAKLPGYGGDFATKYKATHTDISTGVKIVESDQLLVSIFDYIRCVNLHDRTRDSKPGASYFSPNGQVTPIQIKDFGRGYGRYFTFSEFGVHFICSADGDGGQPGGKASSAANGAQAYASNYPPLASDDPSSSDPAKRKENWNFALEQNKPLQANQRRIQACFLAEAFCAAFGYYKIDQDASIRISGLESLSIDNKPLGFVAGGDPKARYSPGAYYLGGRPWHGRPWGGTIPLRAFMRDQNYPFVSAFVTVSSGKSTMRFSGGKVTVEVYEGTDFNQPYVQRFLLDFPAAEIPIPSLVMEGTTPFRTDPNPRSSPAFYWWTFNTGSLKNMPYQDVTYQSGRLTHCKSTPHVPGPEYSDPARRWPAPEPGTSPGFKWGSVFRQEDVARTIIPTYGDQRLLAALKEVPELMFTKNIHYDDPSKNLNHLFSDFVGPHFCYGFGNEPINPNSGEQLTKAPYHYSKLPDVPIGTSQAGHPAYNALNDYDNAIGSMTDGAYINKPDEGNKKDLAPYFSWDYQETESVFFSPNRIVPSSGMLGSLPTGAMAHKPWQTLLFRAQKGHPGLNSPPDHCLMDFFWMPLCEPYALSEPFSTAGKINLNYRMLPFAHIKRTTALRAALKSELPLIIENRISRFSKLWDHEIGDNLTPDNGQNTDAVCRAEWRKLYDGASGYELRKPLDLNLMIQQCEERLTTSGELYRGANEICNLHLVRKGESLTSYQDNNIWNNALATGDNVRERPYANLYQKLTTKSNTYTVHVWSQALQKSRATAPDEFDPAKDAVLSEYRGSVQIERFIDPTDATIPNYASNASGNPAPVSMTPLDKFYRLRILSRRRFQP